MIKVLFFAQLREALNCSQLEIPLATGANDPFTVAKLKALLATRGASWKLIFNEKQVLTAVNQLMANDGTGLASGDEVAFFPPVTGG